MQQWGKILCLQHSSRSRCSYGSRGSGNHSCVREYRDLKLASAVQLAPARKASLQSLCQKCSKLKLQANTIYRGHDSGKDICSCCAYRWARCLAAVCEARTGPCSAGTHPHTCHPPTRLKAASESVCTAGC